MKGARRAARRRALGIIVAAGERFLGRRRSRSRRRRRSRGVGSTGPGDKAVRGRHRAWRCRPRADAPVVVLLDRLLGQRRGLDDTGRAQCHQERDQRVPLRLAEVVDEVVAGAQRLAAMGIDGLMEGRCATVVQVGRRVGDAPQPRGDEVLVRDVDRAVGDPPPPYSSDSASPGPMSWRLRSENSGTSTPGPRGSGAKPRSTRFSVR